MHKRLIIVSIIIFTGLCGLCALGYYSISLHAEGLTARRANEFVAVAEQIRLDVKRKLDNFIDAEQKRSYTDYQYFYVPFASNDASALVRSPLADNIDQGLAYGHFQLESDGTIVSPYNMPNEVPADSDIRLYINDLKLNLLAALGGNGPAIGPTTIPEIAMHQRADRKQDTYAVNDKAKAEEAHKESEDASKIAAKKTLPAITKGGYRGSRRSAYQVQSLEDLQQQKTQVITRNRANVERNISNTQMYDNLQMPKSQSELAYGFLRTAQRRVAGGSAGQPEAAQSFFPGSRRETRQAPKPELQIVSSPMPDNRNVQSTVTGIKDRDEAASAAPVEYKYMLGADYARQTAADTLQIELSAEQIATINADPQQLMPTRQTTDQPTSGLAEETVQIRIEPFWPIVVPGQQQHTEFPGQIFFLRHIQIEQKHFLQGFRLNEPELIRQVEESAYRHIIGRDMGLDVGCKESPAAAHTAVLDFGFGELLLNLFERKPHMIASQVSNLKKAFFAIVAVVFIAVMIAQASLWRTAREQIKLARKKDDFISAVSHELRTPLTTIRMHTEMLERGWITSEEKRSEYYSTMRQESERLSRLIENVLDFSRIQRGRKKYRFKLGDINQSVSDVVDMMTPCASQAGFSIEKDLGNVPQLAFDHDAVMQIVINLLDNAIKYAKNAAEKTITVRTRCDNGYTIIEVEDHGPGVPRLHRQKVFDEFYRCQDESRRETTGTGLGLALVKKFAQAHNGFVEILTAKPTGAIFRVALGAPQPEALRM